MPGAVLGVAGGRVGMLARRCAAITTRLLYGYYTATIRLLYGYLYGYYTATRVFIVFKCFSYIVKRYSNLLMTRNAQNV